VSSTFNPFFSLLLFCTVCDFVYRSKQIIPSPSICFSIIRKGVVQVRVTILYGQIISCPNFGPTYYSTALGLKETVSRRICVFTIINGAFTFILFTTFFVYKSSIFSRLKYKSNSCNIQNTALLLCSSN
jgi:hypothetical protein